MTKGSTLHRTLKNVARTNVATQKTSKEFFSPFKYRQLTMPQNKPGESALKRRTLSGRETQTE